MKRCPLVLLAFLSLLATVAQSAPGPLVRETVMVPMRDHVRLATDLFLPATNRPFPVVLVRTPYDKTGLRGAAEAAVQRGYVIVVQDTRGRFASEGENLPFFCDDQDGADTIAWIRGQGWSNGKIGTFGGSALGITQLQLAGTGPEGLACQHIAVATANLYDVAYRQGVFRKALVEDWLRATKFSPRALELWTGHSSYDQFWLRRDVTRHLGEVNAPAIHIGGYFDIFAQGTIDAFVGFQTKGGPGARGQQKLLIGPWQHGVLTDKAGELRFPNAQQPPNNVQDQFRWWDYYLKGIMNGVAQLPAVTYYVMGDVTDTNAPGNVWRTAAQWPPVATKRIPWYFHSDQSLSPVKPMQPTEIGFISDPQNPVPTVGGYELTIPAGPRDQRSIEERPDVVVFTSAPLEQPMEITGTARVHLYAFSDAPDTDFIVRLCDVYPDGRSFNICEGMIRARYHRSLIEPELLVPNKVYSLPIDLWPTSIVFNKGHRLRVHVTSSSVPGYDPNPNTGEPLRWSSRTAVAHNGFRIRAPQFSRLELPVAQ